MDGRTRPEGLSAEQFAETQRCKTVVGNRLKGGGMRWGQPGSDAVAQLRAVYLSEPACWNTLWRTAAA
jgi:hypothetical protein